MNPAVATTRTVSAPYRPPIIAPIAAPSERAPYAMMLIAETRPRSSGGVTVCGSVVVETTHTGTHDGETQAGQER
jgi:hypothetical protein